MFVRAVYFRKYIYIFFQQRSLLSQLAWVVPAHILNYLFLIGAASGRKGKKCAVGHILFFFGSHSSSVVGIAIARAALDWEILSECMLMLII